MPKRKDFVIPEGKVIDFDRLGSKGFPRHWEAYWQTTGNPPPLKDAPTTQEPESDDPAD